MSSAVTVWRSAISALTLWVALLPGLASSQTASEQLRRTVEYASLSGDPAVAGASLIAADLLARFYASRRFELVWSDARDVEVLLAALDDSAAHGLMPRDFHVHRIRLLLQLQAEQPDDPRIGASLDLLLSDGLVHYAYQLVYGKVDPQALSVSRDWRRPLLSLAPEQALAYAIAPGNLAGFLESLQPPLPYYRSMQAELASYRGIESRGGWPVVPGGSPLRRGDQGPRVAAVRARLAAEYAVPELSHANPQLFDETLEDGVRRFQSAHALAADGIVGPATLAAMNVSAAQRVDQIRANLERARWAQAGLADARDFVMVNVAGFYVRLYEDGEIDWESRVIVGTDDTQTPTLAADMTYLVLNPTWTVPRSIIRDEMLPAIQADPTYLAAQNLALFDQDWRGVDPAMLDWQNVNASNFPYHVVQRPGAGNTLGAVKFMFPNAYSVYLHDTPRTELFSRAQRAFSHGCVRVENPRELATRLLADQPDWTRELIDRAIQDGQTTTVYLTTPLRVHLVYWTAEPGDDGRVRFYGDVYARDAALVAALDQSAVQ